METLWTTSDVSPKERLSYWVDAVCRTYTSLDCEERAQETPFYGRIDAGTVGRVRLTQVRASAQKVRRTKAGIARHDEDKLLFSIQKSGRCNIVQDGRVASLGPGDFALYDTTRPYDLVFDKDFTQLVVALPGDLLRPHLGAPDRLTARRIPGNSSIGRAVVNAVESVMGDEGNLQPSAGPMEEALRGLLAAGVLAMPGSVALSQETETGARRAMIKAYVLENLRDPQLDVRAIAFAHGIDASTVHRSFDGGDDTITRWIWRQRLENARREICSPTETHRTLTDIAFSWGFNDMAHFSRAFKARFGRSPRDYRRSEKRGHS